MTGFLFQLAVIFMLGYFLILRPQQKKRKAHEDRIRQLGRGDEIVTSGGLIGEIVHVSLNVKDGAPTPTLEDRVTIKSGESRIIVERGSIARVLTQPPAEKEEKAK